MGVLQLGDTTFRDDANLNAYYKLEGTADETSTYNLTNIGTVTFVAAMFGNGAAFGTAWGHTKTLRNASNLGVNMDADWSINMWVKINTAPPVGSIGQIFMLADTGRGYSALNYDNSSGVMRLNRYLDGVYGASNYDLGTANFNMITLVRNTGTGYLYVNGNYIGGHAFGTNTATSYFRLANNSAETSGIPARIDDVSVFDRALSLSEINQLYTGPGTKFDLTSKSW